MSDYYNPGSAPSNGSFGSSAVIRAEFGAVASGISEKLPPLSGAANKAVVINSSATGMTTATLNKTAVGLGNVDNTSDLDKPLSTAAIAANDAQNTVISGKATAGNVAPDIHAATSKATPVSADEFGLADSAASYALKKVTLTQLATALGVGSAPTMADISNVSSTITWNCTVPNSVSKITLDGDKTLNLGTMVVGWHTLVVTQMSPAKTMTYGSGISHFGVGAGFTPDLGSAAGNKTVISGFYDGVEMLTGNSPRHY